MIVLTRTSNRRMPSRICSGSTADPPQRVASKRNAPSRWRLRPAFRLTSAEAVAYRRTLNLGRSVLGAVVTLRTHALQVKRPALDDFRAICRNRLLLARRMALPRVSAVSRSLELLVTYKEMHRADGAFV